MNIWKITETNKIVRTEKKVEEDSSLIKVRVARAALTDTDFLIFAGLANTKFPIIPSKSAIGLISNANNPLGLKVGERVLLSAYTPCDECNTEIETQSTFCDKPIIRGVDDNGFLCDFAYVNKNCVFPLPESVSDTECLYYDYISVSLSALQKMQIEKGEYVVIVGGDIQSLIFAEIVNYYQAIPILVTKSDLAIRQAKQNGIDYAISTRKFNAVDKVFEITGGKMAEHVAYSVYSGESESNILSFAKHNANVGILGYNNQTKPIELNVNELVERQLSIYSIKHGMQEVTSAINLLAMKAINTNLYQTSTISFASVESLFGSHKASSTPGLIVVDCNDA